MNGLNKKNVPCEYPCESEVRRVTWIGLAVNLFLSAFKFVAGVLGHSQVVVADAVHSLSDSTTDIALLVGVSLPGQNRPDESHPYGHRPHRNGRYGFHRCRTGGGGGVVLAYRGLATIREHHNRPPGWIAFLAAMVSIVVKEVLYRWTSAIGIRVKSSAVVANAWHHRSDALSSIPAAIAVAVAVFVPSWSFLDHVGAILVSLFILHAAWKIGWPALGQMVDTGASEKVCSDIREIAVKTAGVQSVHAIRTRYLGSGIQVDLHVLVNPDLTVRRGHEISEDVEKRLLASVPDVLDVVVHIEPSEQHKS